jgi:hypothetical protein
MTWDLVPLGGYLRGITVTVWDHGRTVATWLLFEAAIIRILERRESPAAPGIYSHLDRRAGK